LNPRRPLPPTWQGLDLLLAELWPDEPLPFSVPTRENNRLRGRIVPLSGSWGVTVENNDYV
jgi:hypothetical protein